MRVRVPGTPGKVSPYLPPFAPPCSPFFLPVLSSEKVGVMTRACDFVVFECMCV